MSAAPARRVERPSERLLEPPTYRCAAPRPPATAAAAAALRVQRRRRERHFRRRRRDLLEDAGLALVLTVALVSLTAGLGVLALIAVPLAVIVIASMLAERARRRRQAGARRARSDLGGSTSAGR